MTLLTRSPPQLCGQSVQPVVWKVMGSTSVGGSENYFSEYFHLRTLLRYLHFIQVINPFIIYSHLSFPHVEPCDMAGHASHSEGARYWKNAQYMIFWGSSAGSFPEQRLEIEPAKTRNETFSLQKSSSRKLFPWYVSAWDNNVSAAVSQIFSSTRVVDIIQRTLSSIALFTALALRHLKKIANKEL